MNQITRFTAVVLALLLLLLPLSFAAAEAAQAADPVVVQVGDVSYPLSVVQPFYDSMVDQYTAAGAALDEASAEEMLDIVLEGYVDLGVSELKCAELGLTSLTAEQEAEVAAAAQDAYDAARDEFVKQIVANFGSSEDEAKESAPTLMRLNGYTYDAFYAQQLSAYHNKLMLDYVNKDASYTDDELAAYVEETFVAPSRELYKDNYPRFEQDVLVNGGDCYYFPAGIRMIDMLWLPTPEDFADRLTALSADDTRKDELNELLLEIGAYYDKEIAAIHVAAAAGGNFDSVVNDYPAITLDSGYFVHAESSLWGLDMRDAALALKSPGDVSDVMYITGELCVLCYRADVPEGLPPYDEASLQTLYDYAEENLRVAVLDQQLEAWKSDYEIALHPEHVALGV